MKQITSWRRKTKACSTCLNLRSSEGSPQLQNSPWAQLKSQLQLHCGPVFSLLIPILLTSLQLCIPRPLPHKLFPHIRICFSGIHHKAASDNIVHQNNLNCCSKHSPSTPIVTLTPMLPSIIENEVLHHLDWEGRPKIRETRVNPTYSVLSSQILSYTLELLLHIRKKTYSI